MRDKPKNKALDPEAYKNKRADAEKKLLESEDEEDRKRRLDLEASRAARGGPQLDLGAIMARAMQHAVRQDHKRQRERRKAKTRRAARQKNRES